MDYVLIGFVVFLFVCLLVSITMTGKMFQLNNQLFNDLNQLTRSYLVLLKEKLEKERMELEELEENK